MKSGGSRTASPRVVTLLLAGVGLLAGSFTAQAAANRVTVDWQHVVQISKTTATLQVVVNPPLRRGSAIHDRVFQALKNLGADYVRYVPWLPYPKLAVAELEPPRNGKTSWDFSLIDPLTIDFLNATAGHPVIMNFSTIPAWMFLTPKPVPYPKDPNQVTWHYTQGTRPRDPSLNEISQYYERLVSWYTKGGFTDEYGRRHHSGYHYKFAYWEVLNEVEGEHKMTPAFYTALYDAVVSRLHRLDPAMQFVGMALLGPMQEPEWFEYFLNRKHHRPGIPLDMISYHFYATPGPDETAQIHPYTFFERADHFLDIVRYIESIRKRRSPTTRTTIDEIGSILPHDNVKNPRPIPNSYWNLSGAMYAYIYGRLANLGIDVAGESQLVGYPTQFPSVSMIDWKTGRPNARYWVLKLLRDNFGPGDELLGTRPPNRYVYAQAFRTRDGKRKLLLVNKRDRSFAISVPGAAGGELHYVDQTTGFQPPATAHLASDQLRLRGLAVAVVKFPPR